MVVNDKPSMSEIKPGLFLGNYASSWDITGLTQNHIAAIVSVVDTTAEEWDLPANRDLVPKDRHLIIPCFDSATQDLLQHLAGACDFIDAHKSDDSPGNVLVHCLKGVSRSATVVIAYLMRSHSLSLDRAFKNVKKARGIRPNRDFLQQLGIWAETGYEVWADEAKTVPKPAYAEYLSRRAEVVERLGEGGS